MGLLDVFFTLGPKLMELSYLGHSWPCGIILYKGSENFLLEMAQIISAHMPLAPKSQLSKFDIREKGGVSPFHRVMPPRDGSIRRSGNVFNNPLRLANCCSSLRHSTFEKAQLSDLTLFLLSHNFDGKYHISLKWHDPCQFPLTVKSRISCMFFF